MKKSKYMGSTFDSFLEEEGMLAEIEAKVLKRILVWQLSNAMEEQKVTKSEIAKRMHTSRSSVDRLLDPNNISINLMSMEKAVVALGKRINIEIQDASFI